MPADWLEGVADALGVPHLTPPEVERLLELARVVAHGTERKNAPLATFLVGRAIAGGTDLTTAMSVVGRCMVNPSVSPGES